MSAPKRVLQVSPAYYPAISIGGPIFTNLTFSKALEDVDCQIEVLTTTQGLTEEQKAQITIGQLSTTEFSYPIWRFPYIGYSNYTFSPGLFFWLFKHVKRFDLVVMQAVWNFPIMAAYLACKWHKIPFFIIPHGSLYDETFHLKSSKVKKFFLALYVKKMLIEAKRVLFSTRDESLKVNKFLSIPIKSSIVPNIVDVENFNLLPAKGTFRQKFGLDEDQIILTHYGRVTIKKGINYVLDVLPELIKQYPKVLYVIAGSDEGNYVQELQDIIQKNNLEKHVVFTGLLSPEEGKELLVDTQIFVLPSLSENFGMSVVEALLCGASVIISEHVGIALDLQEAGGAKVIKLNDQSLFEAIYSLLENTNEREKMAQMGREFVIQNYSYQAVEKQLTQLIHG